jgi:transposase
MVFIPDSLDQLSAQELRELLSGLMTKVAQQDQQIASNDRELLYRQTKIDQLTHEMAVLKRHQFGRSREQLDSTQASLLEEAFDEDLAAIEQELQNLTPPPKTDTEPPKKPQTCCAASRPAACRCPSRTRFHHLQMWLPTQTNR